ncbi:hypothetical protein AiwAL_14235 [Acidiphilium sp. AL]|uniref:Uncharacterized protein n=1 Tax=Acidiphilium iwatense TaxID=768198 RepID=A0ABS9E011_9PROT|nr:MULTISPECIES: hypothetical protein [Acidiphilium]MCF3948283.1 hypothetical protein [Acidiphilium iwatense]MCU4161248.1 hypothetical protein [Acidiphilium sp. AL]
MPFDMTTREAGSGETVPARPEIKPFASAERAWLWAAGCLAARRAGQPAPRDPAMPCTPETILLRLDRLYRARRIDLVHVRILRRWGDRGRAPDPRRGGDRNDWRQWRAALAELEDVLRELGIVAGFEIVPNSLGRENFCRKIGL